MKTNSRLMRADEPLKSFAVMKTELEVVNAASRFYLVNKYIYNIDSVLKTTLENDLWLNGAFEDGEWSLIPRPISTVFLLRITMLFTISFTRKPNIVISVLLRYLVNKIVFQRHKYYVMPLHTPPQSFLNNCLQWTPLIVAVLRIVQLASASELNYL